MSATALEGRKSYTPLNVRFTSGLNAWRRVALGLMALVVVGASALFSATPAQAAGERVVWQTGFNGATVQLWYNNGYNWVSVSSSDGRASEAGIYSPNSGWKYSLSYGSAPSRYTTPAVYAPGSTCVNIRVTKQSNNWPYSSSTGNWQIC